MQDAAARRKRRHQLAQKEIQPALAALALAERAYCVGDLVALAEVVQKAPAAPAAARTLMMPGSDPVEGAQYIVAGAQRIAASAEGMETANFAMQPHRFHYQP